MASASASVPRFTADKVKFSNEFTDADGLHFTWSDTDVCYVNALRRIILTQIPICCIRSEDEAVNQVHISVNTTRLHNEILKHRLSMIPIHTIDLEFLPDKWELVLDSNDIDFAGNNEKNEANSVSYITSEHFRLRRKCVDEDEDNDNNNGDEKGNKEDEWMPMEEVRKLFPPDPITGDFIDFARLRHSFMDDTRERLALVADFSVATAADNAMYNVVSKCSYMNTIDMEAAAVEVARLKSVFLETESNKIGDWSFHEKNFWLLDAQRFYVSNSFDFVIKSIGVYADESSLRDFALSIIARQLMDIHDKIQDGTFKLVPLDTGNNNNNNNGNTDTDTDTFSTPFELRIYAFDFAFAKIIEHNIFTHVTFVASQITHPHLLFFSFTFHFHKLHDNTTHNTHHTHHTHHTHIITILHAIHNSL